MSLRSLLPLGKTLDRSGERSGRFQPAEPGLLPDFSKDIRDGRELRGGGGVRAFPAGEGRRGSGVEGAGDGGVGESGGTGLGAGGPARSRPRAGAATGRRLPAWLERLLLVLMRPGNRRRGSREVQGEFLLQSVKVVKNDLVTSDVEVVRTAVRPKPMSASCRARLMALWWAPVARRLGRWGNRTDKL